MMSGEYPLLEPKANLFSTISTIERIVENFKGGKIQPNIYRKQLNALVREYYALTNQLLRSGFDLRRFYREEGIIKRFPQAFERINNKQLDLTQTPSPQQIPPLARHYLLGIRVGLTRISTPPRKGRTVPS